MPSERFHVSSKHPRGHFRAGRFWPHEGVEVASLSKEAREMLEADPRIVIKSQTDEGGLEALTVEQLKALAAERGVDLGDAKKKAEILEALSQASPDEQNEASDDPEAL